MKASAEKVYQFLVTKTEVQAVLGNPDCRVFPVVAPEGTAKPFAIYSIASFSASMDGRQDSGLVSVYFDGNSWTEMVAFADTLQQLFDERGSGFDVGEIETGYSEKYDTMVANININIY